MNYATIKYYDISNGIGVRTSLFVSGCTHRCKNCFNSEAWDFSYGNPFTEEVMEQILSSMAPDYIAGLSLLGGEPLEPENQRALLPLLQKCKQRYPDKTIWCYTGYTFEYDLLKSSRARCEITDELLSYIDVLVDGEFIQDLYDVALRFRGSSNQRLIDLPASLKHGVTVLWEDDPIFSKRQF
jgi:anaerobic ribonucleoside-triphosphate reductase activating protein